MISFRYHIVSLVAVFLALALGIVVGTTTLNGPITDDLRKQVNTLKDERTAVSEQNKTLQGQLDDAEEFAASFGPQIVRGTLTGQKVLLVGLPGAEAGVKDEITEQVRAAGGEVTLRVQLSPDYTDPKRATEIVGLATGGTHPVGLTLPATQDAGQLGGALLAHVLLGKGQPTDLRQVLAGFTELRMLKVESSDTVPATAVIVVGGAATIEDEAIGKSEVSLVAALKQAGGQVVVSASTGSAKPKGVIAYMRGNGSVKGGVSSVDNASSSIGAVTTVLALAGLKKSQVGHYGTGPGADALFPGPVQ